ERPLCAGTDAAAGSARVGRAKAADGCRLCGTAGNTGRNCRRIRIGRVGANHAARINTIAEEADDTEQFVVTEAGVGSGLEDQIGSLVGGVTVGVESVVQTASSAWGVDEEVSGGGGGSPGSDDGRRSGGIINRGNARETASADGGLRSFYRCGQRKLAAEILHHAEAILTGPSEADDILRID